jgi:hypothetical protein
MTKNPEERMAIVETKLDTVIQQQQKISDKLDMLQLSLPTFVTHTQLEEKLASIDKSIDEVANKNQVRSVIRDVLLVMLTSSATFLLYHFFNSL